MSVLIVGVALDVVLHTLGVILLFVSVFVLESVTKAQALQTFVQRAVATQVQGVIPDQVVRSASKGCFAFNCVCTALVVHFK